MIDKAINIFSKNIKKYTSLRSVEEMSETALKSLFVEKNIAKSIIRNNSMDDINFPRQKFKKTYYANGYVDIYKTSLVKNKNKLYGNKVMRFTDRTIEIDSVFDLNLAENYQMKNLKTNTKI